MQKTAHIERKLDIRGMMVDEAEMVVGKFLDDAVMAGLSQVLIIHGKLLLSVEENLQIRRMHS